MSLRFSLAKAAGAVSTWGLRHVAHRPAANLPGKIALKIDPSLLDELRSKCTQGSVITVGTNGKTSTNNLLADAFEAAGRTIICNRTGANLAAGISSALLQQPAAQWGVFECDELWLAHVLPHLRSNYVLLLNLFRDQLDRCGEIDRIQTSIAGALIASPDTVLVYNADDPLCARIADEVPNRTVAFGLSESMGLAQNTVTDAQMCQKCDGMVRYHYRQYGQLGDYFCDQCDFARPTLDFAGRDIAIGPAGVTMEVCGPAGCESVHTPQPTPYAAYNLVASYALCREVGIPTADFQRAQDAFNPRNGRLQRYRLGGRDVLLNLAKNPTGFNQNLKIVEADRGPKMVAFFINDQVADGRDISWIWDIDFEELAGQPDTVVFAGGSRAHDLAVRLKYAGIEAAVIESIEDAFARLGALTAAGVLPADAAVYAIANYTALPPVHAALNAMEAAEPDDAAEPAVSDLASPSHAEGADPKAPSHDAAASASATATSEPPVVIAHMLPDLLNLYGDGGNVRILEQRLRWRGIPVEVRRIQHGEAVDFSQVDLVFMGGGPDREQKLASEQLLAMRDELAAYVEGDGPLLAICGGYQILGRQWLWGDELVPGLGLIDMETRRPGTSADRLIDNMVLESPLAAHPVVGYENHAGRTYLGEGVEGFGRVVSSCGHGNNDDDRVEGARYKNVVGTYSHGPLLSKNPEVADWLLARALERRAERTGTPAADLAPLDDSAELAANASMVKRLS
ncbi:MurT ligase domain-containing protein [Adlercreutzia equolifaciens]|uniref:MurT ligase domain-containing protein n=1 Tax=Adlercreutzia equolifaciens TaxID=446660 RepID=UPI001EDD1A36|nr:MurT ligase domain-containing protein [Adlercreutzia equolifaciens]MCG4824609.1 MurT ligase domain-containing protein [Adlercreutzia equolifaciens]